MNGYIYINRTGKNFPIYGGTNNAQTIGTLRHGELFVHCGGYDYAMTSGKGWTKCAVGVRNRNEGGAYAEFFRQFDGAFEGKFAFRTTHDGYIFKVRHSCRVFNGTTMVTRLYAGAEILVKKQHTSIAGSSYPYRLKIHGYRESANHYFKMNDNFWCDTDMEIAGYSHGSKTAVYGNWGV